MSRLAKVQFSRHLPVVSTPLVTTGIEQPKNRKILTGDSTDPLVQTWTRWLDLSLLAAVCSLLVYQHATSLQYALTRSVAAVMAPFSLSGGAQDQSVASLGVKTAMAEQDHTLKVTRAAEVLRQFFPNDVELTIENNAIVLQLVDDFFAKREYQLEAEKEELLRRIFSAAYATNENFLIRIIGHSDDVPVLHRSKRIRSNQDLALMRAKAAADLAIDLGFAQSNVHYVQDSEMVRNTRSLSIHLQFGAS